MNLLAICRNYFLMALVLVSATATADVNDTSTERRLSIPGGTQGIVIPRGDWTLSKEQRRPGDTAVYYMLISEKRQMIFSVYIDKTSACNSADSCLETALTNTQYKEAKELRKSEVGKFKVAQFFVDNPRGAAIKQANLVVSAYSDGQWCDIHITKSGTERPEMAALLDFLREVTLK